MSRAVRRLSLAAIMAAALLVVPMFGSAAPAPCQIGQPGCKTVDSPKNNPKFSETQRGNVDASGTSSTCFDANRGQTKQTC